MALTLISLQSAVPTLHESFGSQVIDLYKVARVMASDANFRKTVLKIKSIKSNDWCNWDFKKMLISFHWVP